MNSSDPFAADSFYGSAQLGPLGATAAADFEEPPPPYESVVMGDALVRDRLPVPLLAGLTQAHLLQMLVITKLLLPLRLCRSRPQPPLRQTQALGAMG